MSEHMAPAARWFLRVVWLGIAVAARLAGTVFFLGWQPREYSALGYLDLAFFMPQALLLTGMAPAVSGPAAVAASPVAGAGGAR